MSDRFAGAWAVREYVFDPAGNALGTVAQRRRVVAQPGGGLRVMQDCTPDPLLAGHPMASFVGHHEFDLSREGAVRRYHGPDVIGSAVCYGDGAMCGRGVWPQFGYNFRSWSVMLGGERQLTGGRFSRAGEPMAVIVGIGVPARNSSSPVLAEPMAPSRAASQWRGSCASYGPDGSVVGESSLRRDYAAASYVERGQRPVSLELSRGSGAVKVAGTSRGRAVIGFARRYGWVSCYELASSDGGAIDTIEAFDPSTSTLVGFRRHRDAYTITRVDVIRLQPQ